MRVYTLTRTDISGSYTADDLDYIKEEIEIVADEKIEELKELPIVIKEALLPELIKELKKAEIGDSFKLEIFIVTVREMSEESYSSLSEFEGW